MTVSVVNIFSFKPVIFLCSVAYLGSDVSGDLVEVKPILTKSPDTRKVNVKRLILSVIAMFVFIFASDFVIHSLLLGQTYKELAHLWRPEAELVSFMPWMMLGQLLIAKFYVLLFIRGYEGKGITEGLRFGLVFIGPYSVAPFLIQYAVIPHLPVQWRCVRCRWPDVRGH